MEVAGRSNESREEGDGLHFCEKDEQDEVRGGDDPGSGRK